jgi:hypothetical protein
LVVVVVVQLTMFLALVVRVVLVVEAQVGVLVKLGVMEPLELAAAVAAAVEILEQHNN